MGAAAHRAAHQLLEGGRILFDPLALPILGAPIESLTDESRRETFSRALRLFIALRSRLAEDAVAQHAARGLRQLVILGAGLDTYAYRSPFGNTLRFFEVDHPATQEWKRRRLAAAGIAIPEALHFAPVDFERETLADGLAAAGFDPDLPTFFTWLGVVPYLTEAAVFATLAYIAGLSGGSEVIFDYANPRTDDGAGRAGHEALAARVASIGEAFESFFETDVLTTRLLAMGFTDIEDWGPAQIHARFAPGRGAAPSNRGGHILRASRSAGVQPRYAAATRAASSP
jgi:methyltransferase (TIGR00027 family)